MSSLAYVNGRYLPLSVAGVSLEDRGFQFADSIYEVCAVLNGRLLDWDRHLWRLRRGLAALFIEMPMTDAAFGQVARRLLMKSRIREGLLYIQVTRGVARRDHHFPSAAQPTLVMTARGYDFGARLRQQREGVSVISLPDQRWKRCDIKSTALLPNVLAKQEARRMGAAEAMLVDDQEQVTEGGSTNMWMVTADGAIVTRQLGGAILPGVMRDTLIGLARADGLVLEERSFGLADARQAPELFMTATTAPVIPIVRLDGKAVGSGRPGRVTSRLAAMMWDEIERQTGYRPRG